MNACATCGGKLHEVILGTLGHGGSNWWECENKCEKIWKDINNAQSS